MAQFEVGKDVVCIEEHVGAHGAESDTIATLDILDVQMEEFGGNNFDDNNH